MKPTAMKKRLLALLLGVLVCSTGLGRAAPSPGGIDRPTSKPYTGDLAIFEGAQRAKNLQVDRVMDLLGIHPGAKVADIGAGGGWFAVRAARRVGLRGLVYAEDIYPPYVKAIAARARKEHLPNVRAVLGKPDDPRLPAGQIDAVLFLKSYHEVAEPMKLLRQLRAALRTGANVGIIDRNGNGADHGVNANQVIAELRRAGFFFVSKHAFVKADGDDYFLIFR